MCVCDCYIEETHYKKIYNTQIKKQQPTRAVRVSSVTNQTDSIFTFLYILFLLPSFFYCSKFTYYFVTYLNLFGLSKEIS